MLWCCCWKHRRCREQRDTLIELLDSIKMPHSPLSSLRLLLAGGHLKPQAQKSFEPKWQPSANQKDTPGFTTSENMASSKQEGSIQSLWPQPVEQQSPARHTNHKSPAETAARLPAKSASQSPSRSPAPQPAKQQSGPVEDLDELHTLQVMH